MYIYGYSFFVIFFFFKQKTAYDMRISDWSSDVCSSDLAPAAIPHAGKAGLRHVEAAAQIDADHFVPIFKAHIQESAVARNACIVDHNIDRAHVFGDLRAKVFAGVKVAHVPFIISYAGSPDRKRTRLNSSH